MSSQAQRDWGSGYAVNRPVPPAMPTEFEMLAEKLHLRTEDQIIGSAKMYTWARAHKNLNYIPEQILNAWGLRVHVGEL